MFSRWYWALASAAVLVPVSARAELKVAVINFDKAVVETAEIKKAQVELEAKFKPRQQQVEALQKQLQDIQQQLQTMVGKLTPQAEAQLNADGQRKQRELQRLGEDLQADVERDRTEILSKSGQRMQEVVKKLAEAKDLDAVINANGMLFFKPVLDLTKDATEAYDKAYPVK
jgi:outer membrane protein